ncbi:hypothetical protein PghCCS26_47970 [Paenibacillus glycanilyticus]|uniref:Uncharacterized protein n=1 Tax=Paenibacillus glycanilyticus TaxID=126569 RepID=A0ABQ6NRD0_9BACL|nr:hypothetical protein PghCCS26_47970 [Paenibacillus glycanilyticus]
MDQYIRKAVSFNANNPKQRELFDWVTEQCGNNFSGYVKAVLFAQMHAENRRVLEQVRKSSDSSSDNKTDEKMHESSPPFSNIVPARKRNYTGKE